MMLVSEKEFYNNIAENKGDFSLYIATYHGALVYIDKDTQKVAGYKITGYDGTVKYYWSEQSTQEQKYDVFMD